VKWFDILTFLYAVRVPVVGVCGSGFENTVLARGVGGPDLSTDPLCETQRMGGTEPQSDLSGTLLELNQGAFEQGHYETAYHLLMAALHAADDESAPDLLEVIARLAAAQQARLDTLAPGHRLTTAKAHGSQGVYSLAGQHAHMRAELIRRLPG
jgi:hypothetical protein